MRLRLKIWRQSGPEDKGRLVAYDMDDVEPDMSFLEMLDVLNEKLVLRGERPVAFDSDCREGICGTCGCMVNGVAHGPLRMTTLCQLFMRHFHDGETVVIEPFRSRAFPLVRDLVIDRSGFETIIRAGGFISARTGSAPESNSIPIPRPAQERSMDAAACISCGACVAACPNGSASLFTAAKIGHMRLLPQGEPERVQRALRMVHAMRDLGFGQCSFHGECEAVCPKGISIDFISLMNREFVRASRLEDTEPVKDV